MECGANLSIYTDSAALGHSDVGIKTLGFSNSPGFFVAEAPMTTNFVSRPVMGWTPFFRFNYAVVSHFASPLCNVGQKRQSQHQWAGVSHYTKDGAALEVKEELYG